MMPPVRPVPGILAAFAWLAIAACEGDEPPAATSKSASMDEAPGERPPPGKPLGRFKLTYYHLAVEPEDAPQKRKLYDKRCRPIARTSRRFARELAMQGSGRLRDGRILNVAGGCDCDRKVCYYVAEDAPWGVGARHPLRPLRSVAAGSGTFSLNTPLYLPRLDGLPIPGERIWNLTVHDGCVIVEDRGVEGRHLDLFVALKKRREFFDEHGIHRTRVRRGGERCAHLRRSRR